MPKSTIDVGVNVSVEKMVHNIMQTAAEEVMEKTGLRVDSLVFQWDTRFASMGEKFPKSPTEISIMTTS